MNNYNTSWRVNIAKPSTFFFFVFCCLLACSAMAQNENRDINNIAISKKKKKKSKTTEIDLSHWKVTVPIGNPLEISPPEILDYRNIEAIKSYMFDDQDRGGLAFYVTPGQTTSNTKYSRSELREQMEPGSNHVNWTFADGGNMVGKLAVDKISKDGDGKYHKVIVMQIHGRLTNEQRDLIGKSDNDAPPMLKIYWQNGKIRVKTKKLKNLDATEEEMLHKDAWGDDDGFTFEEEVNFRKFKLEVDVSEDEMVVSLNDSEFKVYDSDHIKKWGVFENYFKAGNYFQTTDKGAFAQVNYFELEVTH